MIKLIFHRTRAPTAPTWDHQPGFRFDSQAAAARMAAAGCTEPELVPAIASVWQWLLGETAGFRAPSIETVDLDMLGGQLLLPQTDGDEAIRVGAGYRLAQSASDEAVARLVYTLEHGPEAGRRVAVQALGAAGSAAVVSVLVARIGELSADLAAATVRGAVDELDGVVEALGCEN